MKILTVLTDRYCSSSIVLGQVGYSAFHLIIFDVSHLPSRQNNIFLSIAKFKFQIIGISIECSFAQNKVYYSAFPKLNIIDKLGAFSVTSFWELLVHSLRIAIPTKTCVFDIRQILIIFTALFKIKSAIRSASMHEY